MQQLALQTNSLSHFISQTQPPLSKEVQPTAILQRYASSPSLSDSQRAFSSDRERAHVPQHDKSPGAEGNTARSVNNKYHVVIRPARSLLFLPHYSPSLLQTVYRTQL